MSCESSENFTSSANYLYAHEAAREGKRILSFYSSSLQRGSNSRLRSDFMELERNTLLEFYFFLFLSGSLSDFSTRLKEVVSK